MKWKDISSFSKDDKERIPQTFELKAGGLRIVVTRHIHCRPDEWVLNCHPWFNQFVISTGTSDEAKEAALLAVHEKLSKAIDALMAKEG